MHGVFLQTGVHFTSQVLLIIMINRINDLLTFENVHISVDKGR